MNEPTLKTLDNGLRVLLAPCEAESVAVGVFVASGSRHETAKTAGISHFIEHMLFKGTPTRKPLDITRAIEGRGGNFNACTGEESTAYFCHLPDEYLGEAVDILADMYLNATIPDDEFAREKQVVIDEIRMYADEADAVAMENLQRNLFPKSQLGAPVAGTPASLAPLTPDDLRQYIKGHYHVDNTVVVIVGSFDEAKALAAVEKAFARTERSSVDAASRRVSKRTSHLKMTRRDAASTGGGVSALSGRVVPFKSVAKDGIQQAQMALGYRTFGVGDSRKYAATLVDAVLGRGMMSRLFQQLREKRGISYDISSRMQFFEDAGMFVVTAGFDPAKREIAERIVSREIERMAEKPVGAAELKRTKEFLLGNFRLSHEKVTSKLFYWGSTFLAFNRLVPIAEQIEGLKRVTAADVQAAAREIFQPKNRSISWVLPKGEGEGER